MSRRHIDSGNHGVAAKEARKSGKTCVVALIFPRGDCIDARQRKAAKASRLVARGEASGSSAARES
jgi:hypothetical protein